MSRLADVQAFIDASRAIRTPRALDVLLVSISADMAFDGLVRLNAPAGKE